MGNNVSIFLLSNGMFIQKGQNTIQFNVSIHAKIKKEKKEIERKKGCKIKTDRRAIIIHRKLSSSSQVSHPAIDPLSTQI